MAYGESFDVVIIGLGTAGSAAADALARRGLKVVGLEQHGQRHTLGSSHGKTRLIRKSYFEDPAYVPLLQRAYLGWRDLERRTGTSLFKECGLVTIGTDDNNSVVQRTARAAALHNLSLQRLSAQDLRAIFPPARLAANHVAIFEENAGFLLVEDCVEAAQQSAQNFGAKLYFDLPAIGWRRDGDSFAVDTPAGSFRAGQVVFASGAWTPQLLPDYKKLLRPHRVTQHWWKTDNSSTWAAENLPCFAIDLADGLLYGFPPGADGLVKSALHAIDSSGPVDPNTLDRCVYPHDYALVQNLLSTNLRGLDTSSPAESSVCIYTMTADQNFLIDFLVDDPDVLVISACSGHGFKFAPVLGEIAANLLSRSQPEPDIALFSLQRLLTSASTSQPK